MAAVMKSSLLRLATGAVRVWTRVYTWRMPPPLREARRAEIESDVWEFQQDVAEHRSIGPAAHMLIRLLTGIPDDLRWRIDQAAGDGPERGIALSASAFGALLFAGMLWTIDADAVRKRSAFAFEAPTAYLDQAKLTPLAAGIVATVGPTMMPSLGAQLAATARAGGPVFEAASIKPNRSGSPLLMMVPQPGGRFTGTNVSLGMLIRNAYQFSPFEVFGGPDWLESDRFDVVATAGYDAPQTYVRLMLQTLLEERFKLRVHRETRELPIYALMTARGDGRLGAQLRRTPVDIDCSNAPPPAPGQFFPNPLPACGFFGPAPNRANFAFRGLTMVEVARMLKPMVRRSVIDRTGLTGYFDGEFDFTAELGPPPPPPGVPDPFDRQSFPTVFTVLTEQLGLTLDSQRGPVDVLVIESVQQLSPD